MANSKIEWTDAVLNPIVGCSPVSEGCCNCYAKHFARRHKAMGTRGYSDVVDDKGEWTGKVNFIEEKLTHPLHWKKPRRIFVNSMCDLFHENVKFEWVDKILAVIFLARHHIYQVLTKRPQRMINYFNDQGREKLDSTWYRIGREISLLRGAGIPGQYSAQAYGLPWPLPNLHLGVTCENQQTADERIPLLLRCPAAVRFVSHEPALGPIDWNYECQCGDHRNMRCLGCDIGIDWLIFGAETGPKARTADIAWAHHDLEQCRSAGVPFFVKKLSNNQFIPDDLNVREFP